VRDRFAVVLLAGFSCAAWAQSSLPVLQDGIPSEPRAVATSNNHASGIAGQDFSPDQLAPLEKVFKMNGFFLGQSRPVMEFSQGVSSGGVTPVRLEGGTGLESSGLSSDAMEMTLGLPNPFHRKHKENSGAPALYSESEFTSATKYKASSYLPLDSWIYPVFDRLAAMGYIPTSSSSVRPWTRLECARLLAEAHENMEIDDELSLSLLVALDLELAPEKAVIDGVQKMEAQVESVYGRSTSIAGTPLRDSFHFGQTIVDDFGRPYGQGENGITGASMRAESGPLAFYLRGEYQYAAALPAYSQATQQAIANFGPNVDVLPFGWNMRDGTTSRIRLIEAYAALQYSNWQICFGQQGLWWGPDRTTSLILSNNAEAMPMLRLANVSPLKMPGFLSVAGPVRIELFLARQGGVHYVKLGPNFSLYGNAASPLNPPPYIWGATLSFKPTPNFEFGFGQTVIFAGYGRPLNFKTFLHTFSVLGNGQDVDPGKRAEDFNFSYHLPGLRRSVVAYSELFAWNDPIQGKFVGRFAMDPGLYIPRLPRLPKMDLRMEGVYTNLPKLIGPYFYSNAHYPQGYTNYGQIIGSWIGRQGIGGQASSSYWLTARTKATASFRRMTVDQSLLQGGDLSDFSGSMTWLVRPEVEFSATGQLERWKFPLLATGRQSDFTTSFEIRIHPKTRIESNR
jgi:hypothetical protein